MTVDGTEQFIASFYSCENTTAIMAQTRPTCCRSVCIQLMLSSYLVNLYLPNENNWRPACM